MKSHSFKELLVWQKSQALSLMIYKEFAGCRDFGFKDQIQRASVSIMNNIAEGYGRRSDKALINFLNIARGSAAEVESMTLLAFQLGYIGPEAQQKLLIEAEEVGKLVTAFIKRLRTDSDTVGSSHPSATRQ